MIYALVGLVVVYALVAGAWVLRARGRSERAASRGWERARFLLEIAILIGVTVLALTVERATRSLARSEAQTAADAAALAGAASLLYAPQDEAKATAAAIKYAKLNLVRARPPEVNSEDVMVNVDSGTVRVEVHATAYGIPTVLAWLLGVNRVTVSAAAAAEGSSGLDGGPIKVLKLIPLAAATPRDTVDAWSAAVQRITRLEPSAFETVPVPVILALSELGCTIPQAWGNPRPHNVISGEFAAEGQTDWAALCSRHAGSEILVFWGGPASCPTMSKPWPDRNFLQDVGDDGIVFSRGISAIPPSALAGYWGPVGSDPIPEMAHDAISEEFYRKSAKAFYCHEQRWALFNKRGDLSEQPP